MYQSLCLSSNFSVRILFSIISILICVRLGSKMFEFDVRARIVRDFCSSVTIIEFVNKFSILKFDFIQPHFLAEKFLPKMARYNFKTENVQKILRAPSPSAHEIFTFVFPNIKYMQQFCSENEDFFENFN